MTKGEGEGRGSRRQYFVCACIIYAVGMLTRGPARLFRVPRPNVSSVKEYEKGCIYAHYAPRTSAAGAWTSSREAPLARAASRRPASLGRWRTRTDRAAGDMARRFFPGAKVRVPLSSCATATSASAGAAPAAATATAAAAAAGSFAAPRLEER